MKLRGLVWTCEDGGMSAEGRRVLNGSGGRREGASYVIPWGTIFPSPLYIEASVKGSINSFTVSCTFLHSDSL